MKYGVKKSVATVKGVSVEYLRTVKGLSTDQIEAAKAFELVVFADEGDLLAATRANGKTLDETLSVFADKFPHLAAIVEKVRKDGLFSTLFTAAQQGEEARKLNGIFVTQDEVEKAIADGKMVKPAKGAKPAATTDSVEMDEV